MLCEKPYLIGCLPCPCTRCFPCRVNRRRLWASRMLLESFNHADSCFVTLTYDEKYRPKDDSLDPVDAQLWLKRFRKALAPQKIRYFLAGEYGDESQRPHYHAVVFGVDPYTAGGADGQSGVVQDTWGSGFTFVGEFNHDVAQYVAGYVTKKMTQGSDKRLYGRYPEFSRMSLRPGIGALSVPDIARVLASPFGLGSITQSGDVPTSFRLAAKSLPLGRYIRGKLREALGASTPAAPAEATKRYALSMRFLYEDAVKNKTVTSKSYRQVLAELNEQPRKNMVSRNKIYEGAKTI